MGISLPPPVVVEFTGKTTKQESAAKKKADADSLGAPAPKKRKSSFLGKSVTPESRTVYASDPAANAPFNYQVIHIACELGLTYSCLRS